jgi:hypothetical protein
MKIPLRFALGGFDWEVVYRKRLKGRYGDCDVSKRRITLKEGIDQQLLEQTFCHELQHAMEIAMGVNSDDHNEIEIDMRATFLHQFLKTAVYPQE